MQESTTAHITDLQGFILEKWLFEVHSKADKDSHAGICQV